MSEIFVCLCIIRVTCYKCFLSPKSSIWCCLFILDLVKHWKPLRFLKNWPFSSYRILASWVEEAICFYCFCMLFKISNTGLAIQRLLSQCLNSVQCLNYDLSVKNTVPVPASSRNFHSLQRLLLSPDRDQFLSYLLISTARIVMLCQENSSRSRGRAVIRAPVVMST